MNENWRLAWRNLWRNRRRTWLTVGAMVFSNVLLVFLISIQLGSYDMMIENTLKMFTGHIQVQHRDYRDSPRMRYTVPAAESLAADLRDALGVETVAARAEGFVLASSDERSFGIQLIGVQPAYEPLVSSLPGLVREGRWLVGTDAAEIVVGEVLARNLKVGPGDEVTFIGSARDGSFAAGVVEVVGILGSGVAELDRNVAQVPLGYFDVAFAMDGAGHRVVIEAPSLDAVPGFLAPVRSVIAEEQSLLALDWDALQPGLKQAIRADMTTAWFMYAVLILLVALSVLNTQLMSVLERTREFGTMLALGISPGRLGRIVFQETLLMALLGLVLGVGFGFLVASWFATFGLSFPGMAEANAKFNLPEYLYPEISLLSLLWGPAVVYAGALLAAVYPAMRLRGMEPVDAMRAV